ncbi:hypothetical protein VPH35_043929 [Triticum aestivum]
MQKFINDGNAILRNFHGTTKSIAINLCPVNKAVWDIFCYIFPFHLLDTESISRLECIQLSFVSFRQPFEFNCFPSLRKLDLEFMDITRKDLQVIFQLCFLDGELKSDRPLSHLRHLTFIRCRLTRIELILENANICFSMTNFQDVVGTLLNGISSMENLALQIFNPRLETPLVLNSTCLFSHLKCLQLLMGITAEDTDKLPNVVSILRTTPFIEKLEIHFTVGCHLCFADKGTPGNQPLQQREYKYLKSIHMTGYKGAGDQHELLLHVVENALALEVLRWR